MKFDETLLSGYIDGELTPAETAIVERRLAESPTDRATLKALTELHEKLAAIPEEIFTGDPVPGVRERIAKLRLEQDSVSNGSQAHDATAGRSRAVRVDGPAGTRKLALAILSLAATSLLAFGIYWSQASLSPLARSTGDLEAGRSLGKQPGTDEAPEAAATMVSPEMMMPEMIILDLSALPGEELTRQGEREGSSIDLARSITIEVPEERTGETLRWIDEYLRQGEGADLDGSSRQLPELKPGQSIAVRVAAPAGQLAGLLQSVRSWSLDLADRPLDPNSESTMLLAGSSDTVPEASTGFGGGADTDEDAKAMRGMRTAPAKVPSAQGAPAAVAEPVTLGRGALSPPPPLSLGAEVARAVREGQVWIVIRPRP